MAVSRLLKTWAMPPASLPMASMLCAWTGSSSLWRISRRVSASRGALRASSGCRFSTGARLLLGCVRIGSLFPWVAIGPGRRSARGHPRGGGPLLPGGDMQVSVQVQVWNLGSRRGPEEAPLPDPRHGPEGELADARGAVAEEVGHLPGAESQDEAEPEDLLVTLAQRAQEVVQVAHLVLRLLRRRLRRAE